MSKIQILAVAAVVALLPFTAAAQKAAREKPLYDRLGGKKNQLLGVLGPMQGAIVEKR